MLLSSDGFFAVSAREHAKVKETGRFLVCMELVGVPSNDDQGDVV